MTVSSSSKKKKGEKANTPLHGHLGCTAGHARETARGKMACENQESRNKEPITATESFLGHCD